MSNVSMWAACALVFAAALPVFAQGDALEREVLAQERQELDCLKTGDYARFAQLLADDAIFVDTQGSAGKATVVNNTKDFRLEHFTIEDPKFVWLSPTSAMLIYKISETGVSHGKTFSANVNVSALWAKRDGKWVCLFSQETAARPAQRPQQ